MSDSGRCCLGQVIFIHSFSIGDDYSHMLFEWSFDARNSAEPKKVSIEATHALNAPIFLKNCSTNLVL
jgi:hypothetical protein